MQWAPYRQCSPLADYGLGGPLYAALSETYRAGPAAETSARPARVWLPYEEKVYYDPTISRGKNITMSGKIAISNSPAIMIQTYGQAALNISRMAMSGTALLNEKSV